MFPFTILHTLKLSGMTCDKVVLITVQQVLSSQVVLLHPCHLSRSSLIEQMLLISKHKYDMPKRFENILIMLHMSSSHMHDFSQKAKLTSCPEMVAAWQSKP